MILVQMLVTSGKGPDSQWFDYRPGFYLDIVRIEWELDTMEAVIEANAAEYLIKHGYALRLSPEPAPQPIVQLTEEPPIVVEVPASPAPSPPPSASETPPPSAPPPESPPPASQAPPQDTAKTGTASSGGKHKQKEKRK